MGYSATAKRGASYREKNRENNSYKKSSENNRAYEALNAKPSPEKIRDYPHSPMLLRDYSPTRHIELEDARTLVRREGFDVRKLNSAISSKSVKVYSFRCERHEGKYYLDRIDIGRIYATTPARREGLTIERYFTKEEEGDPLENASVRHADLTILDNKGKTVWEMKGVEIPEGWDEGDMRIVAQKYFFKPRKKEWKEKIKQKTGREYEFSPRHLIRRVTNFIADMGWELGYFATEQDREIFREELAKLQIERKVAFNSPVQFNVGIFNEYGIDGSKGINFVRDPQTGRVVKIDAGCYVRPQAHACFIKGPTDNLEAILEHVKDEGAVFSAGSGIGQNIGILREEGGELSGGGKSSGPMSFFEIYDKAAGAIKSGGKSRRAARMTIMDGEHPDIDKFVQEKVDADHMLLDLAKKGWGEGGMNSKAAQVAPYQNTNISVRLDHEFFEKVRKGGKIQLRSVTTGRVLREMEAAELLKQISFGSWRIGDPAVQYRSVIDEMNTCKNSGSITATNPCSEYVFLDDTSCNLASANVANFADKKGRFDAKAYRRAVMLTAIASDIFNYASSYPIASIAQISPEFGTIGVGYAGIGNLLMRRGMPYDSEEGRALIGAITALTTGAAYEASADMAEKLGAFSQFNFNRRPMLEVIRNHKKNLEDIVWSGVEEDDLQSLAKKSWTAALSKGRKFGFRNAQASVIAPTGTISYLLGCPDSTGIEPSPSLAITKNLAGGGEIVVVNKEMENALRNLGYKEEYVKAIISHVMEEIMPKVPRGTVVGAPYLKPEHVKIFDTALGGAAGGGSIAFEGHVSALGAAQPFVSGAISKTCNLPENTSVKQMNDNYLLGDELKLKALAMFRANSKPTAALAFAGEKGMKELARGEKEELPTRRICYENEFIITTEKNGKREEIPFHIIASEYPDGRPGQIVFLSHKAGSTVKALLATHGIIGSKALKGGIHLENIVKSWIGEEFEPSGTVSGHLYLGSALSPLDFAARFFALEYLGDMELARISSERKIDVSQLRGAQNGAFRTYDRMAINDWDYNQVIKDPELGGFIEDTSGSLRAQARRRLKTSGNVMSNTSGRTCNKCGNLMIQKSSICFDCRNCGENAGDCFM